MARFETAGQIVTLFAGAGCVGLLLIVLLTAEANKREAGLENRSDDVVTEAGDMSGLAGIKYIWSKVQNSVRYLAGSDQVQGGGGSGEGNNRRKREASDDYYSNHVIEGEYDEVVESLEVESTSEQEPEVTKSRLPLDHVKDAPSQLSLGSGLSSALLSTGLSGHKIRHIEEKISMLGEESQLVQAVLKMYCSKDETVLYVMCMKEENSKNSTTETEVTDHADPIDETLKLVSKNSTENHKNFTKSLHSYVNVMRNRMAPQVSNSVHSSGICSSFTEFIVVVILTSFANFFIFVLISLYCRISRKALDGHLTESSKDLISEEDDFENLYETEETEQKKWKRKSGNLHVNLCHQIGLNNEFNKI